jgi:hypothetical protein
LNILPVRIIEIYWSAVARLKNKPDITVEATTPTVLFIKRRNTDIILFNIPLAIIEPPKHMAHSISHTVFIMPDMPRVEINSLISGFPEFIPVLP